MSQQKGKNGGAINLLLLIGGVILVIFAVGDLISPQEETLFSPGGYDEATIFYLIIGILLIIAGAIGLKRASNNNKIRRY